MIFFFLDSQKFSPHRFPTNFECLQVKLVMDLVTFIKWEYKCPSAQPSSVISWSYSELSTILLVTPNGCEKFWNKEIQHPNWSAISVFSWIPAPSHPSWIASAGIYREKRNKRVNQKLLTPQDSTTVPANVSRSGKLKNSRWITK